MIKHRLAALSFALFAVFGSPAYSAETPPSVVVSIKPLHSLVAAIMQGVGKPYLLIKGASSPHTYSMRPSDAAELQGADLIFWAGPALEAFLEKPLASLTGDATPVALMNAPGVDLLPPRENGNFEPEDHDEEHADGDHHHDEEIDPHFWLDPENARAAARTIALTLSARDPQHAALYTQNAATLDKKILSLEERLKESTAPLAGRPFIVFHDAYQYFERRFAITATGSITVNPQAQPGAARIAQIEEKLKQLNTVCIFTEPQFAPRLVQTLTTENNVRSGELDPLGASIPEGPDMYEDLLVSLADALKSCLSPS